MTKRSPVMHARRTHTGPTLRALCGVITTSGRITDNHRKVDCKSCLKSLATGGKPRGNPTDPKPRPGRVLLPEGYAPPHENMVSITALNQTLRLQYAGAIGLLCELSVHLSDRDREERDERLGMIEQAVGDFCKLTGWTYRRVLHRIEVFPPQTKGI